MKTNWKQVLGGVVASLGLLGGSAQATLVGQQVNITEQVGQYAMFYFGSGVGGGPVTNTFSRTVDGNFEIGATSATDVLGAGTYLAAVLDIRPATESIWVHVAANYGPWAGNWPWTIQLDFPNLSTERFVGMNVLIPNTSAYAVGGYTFDDNTITLNISGGYLDNVSQIWDYTFTFAVGYTTEAVLPVGGGGGNGGGSGSGSGSGNTGGGTGGYSVPEPGSLGLMLAGLAGLGGVLRRRDRPKA